MNAHALITGRNKRKVVEIILDPQTLWWLAYQMDGRSMVNAPIKIGKKQQEELRAAGYDVKPIQFCRVTEEKTK